MLSYHHIIILLYYYIIILLYYYIIILVSRYTIMLLCYYIIILLYYDLIILFYYYLYHDITNTNVLGEERTTGLDLAHLGLECFGMGGERNNE